MSDLHQKTNESPEVWLIRLQTIDPSHLPLHIRKSLLLSIGYARHLVRKSRCRARTAQWTPVQNPEGAGMA